MDSKRNINGQYVIIDMQQWYKAFVVKRFYLYQSLNSALQLENLPKRDFPELSGRKVDTRIYQELLPTITLIWMSDDNLGFREDFVSFSLYPDQTAEFFKNDALWNSNDFEKMGIEREKILTLLNNNTKDLGFLSQNKLIYAFQKNIVKNKKLTKYFEWFELAEKTRNKNNTEQDFVNYKKNESLMAVIERIKTSEFDYEELSALEALERELALSALWRLDAKIELREEVKEEMTPILKEELKPMLKEELREEVLNEVKEELRGEVLNEVKEEVRGEVLNEVKEELTPKLKEELREEVVLSAFLKGLNPELIASITNLPLSKVLEMIKSYENN